MSNGRWLTKEDIMLDLAVASGQFVGGLNEKYIVVGEKPPQVNKDEEEEEEMQNWTENSIPKADMTQPDLSGITEMLRMVDDYSTLETSSNEYGNLSKLRDSSNNVVVISKLNPNVAEFKPNSNKATLTGQNNNNNLSSHNNIKTEKDVSETPIEKSNKTNDLSTVVNVINNGSNEMTVSNVIDINKRLDISNLEEIEKEKLRENLKTKISRTSNTNCVKVKRQRNLAIATLMKLCSQPAPKQPETNVIKLMTPQDFENPLCDNKQEEVLDSNIELKKDELISQEVLEQSVDKVNKWLKGPEEKTKSQTLFLGPITFKKKEINKISASPTTTDDTSASDSISDFKPSNYATELSEKYKKRLIEKESATDIWTKLEMDLKAKDEIIKKHNLSASTISDSEM